ncbi:MAG TPA: MotA/TolQ/ExbB proton channel family protein, partial [Telluria sp.]
MQDALTLQENHFSIARYWQQGDAISHAVAYLLLAMSLLSWFIIFSKAWSSWRVRRAAPALDAFWAAPTLKDGIALLSLADSEAVYLPLASEAMLHAAGGSNLAGEMKREEQVVRVLRLQINRATHRIESGLTLLASIGATAPFVGLLGTVWGIYHALSNVSAAGTVQIDKIAGPVGEALIMTGFGLVVAIPAVLAYN